jgi:N-acetyl-gamma-glutamyl-phosphate reductase
MAGKRVRPSKRVFDSSKVSDHFAIIPTGKFIPLAGDAAKIFNLVVQRFLGVFMPNAEYEDTERDPLLDAPRQYGLTQKHKHLPEMAAICGLTKDPIFCPIVAPYYAGMEVTVPLFKEQIKGSIEDIKNAYKKLYQNGLISFVENADEAGLLSANALEGKDDMQITVCGNEDRILLTSRYDNLGKGASGAAIECLNIKLGDDETKTLNI